MILISIKHITMRHTVTINKDSPTTKSLLTAYNTYLHLFILTLISTINSFILLVS